MSSTNKKGIIENELYPTPSELAAAFSALVDWDRLEQDCLTANLPCVFIEPCKGTGNIFDAVPLKYKCYAELTEGLNYLDDEVVNPKLKFAATITNPPFSLTEDFLAKSLQMKQNPGFVAYLQRVNYLGSVKRNDFWANVTLPDKIIVATPRPTFAKDGTDSCEYAWLCWDPNNYIQCGNIGSPVGGVGILKWEKPKKKRKSSKKSETDGEKA